MSAAREVLGALGAHGWSIATAESLTGGLVCAALVDVPGASAHVRGGIVAYDTRVKRDALGVDAGLLAGRGAVDPDVAVAMARGVRSALAVDGSRCDVGVATTGVAGPDASEGKPAGTVFVAVVTPERESVRALALPGDRAAVRGAAVRAALELALSAIVRPGNSGGAADVSPA
ncbi:CinA family protein [Microbacterium sp. ZXX196]|uniref:CinA family protein n=1 Tax=Microbacterium sp. ZXX196 TaxID=2609291 RepID=UPI001327D9E0|nr:nicotinamide-nucleotide amidohydrolase family protein [Microbacterium sp. ZXX196]